MGSKNKVKSIKKDVSVNPRVENYPTFSFKYLQKCSYDSCRDTNFFIDFLERLKKLSELDWNEINKSDRHSYGWEKIKIKNIKKALPPFITDDVEYLLAFRANGNNLPFLGLREKNIFHIIFIETNFGDIYNHN